MTQPVTRPAAPPLFARLWRHLPLLAAVPLAACVVAPVQRPYAPPPPVQRPAPVPATQAVQLPPLYFYPEQGQDEARQDRDRYDCYRWAVRETGVDPGMTPVRQTVVPPAPEPVRDGGAVVAGAATGAVIGAVTSGPRHAGPSIVLGAILGATMGSISQEQRAQAAEREQARREAQAQAAERAARQPLDNFRRAMSACMAGRGYRVG